MAVIESTFAKLRIFKVAGPHGGRSHHRPACRDRQWGAPMNTTTVSVVDTLSLLLLATGFAVAGTRRLSLAIWTLAVQSGLLAAVAAVVAVGAGAAHMWAVVVLTVAVKAVAIPAVLFRVLRTLEVRRETNPLVSTRLSLVVAAGLMLGGLRRRRPEYLAQRHRQPRGLIRSPSPSC